MDDNHFLIEWLAYHYHVMNLRHLILTTDPDSITSPNRVLDRWRDRMTIVLWSDEDFLPHDFEKDVEERTFGKHGTKQKDRKLQYHRARQASFNLECLKEHKRKNRGWTMVIDVDEYMTFNPDLRDPDTDDESVLPWNVPPVEAPGSIATILGDLTIPNLDYPELKTPCIPIYRRQFAARESNQNEVNAMVPGGFNGYDFQTLRWRKYGSDIIKYETRLGDVCKSQRHVPNKVIVDLGRVDLQDLNHRSNNGNPHNPLASICPKNVYLELYDTPLMANHYLGTIEQWLYRVGDKRGKNYRIARYEDLNSRIGKSSTDQVRPWLSGFVKSVGEKEAARLLESVGVLEPRPAHEISSLSKKHETTSKEEGPSYKVGDIVQANYKGDGNWYWAEIYTVHSNGYYNIFFLGDCSEEIATFDERLRLQGETDDSTDFGVDLQAMALARVEMAE